MYSTEINISVYKHVYVFQSVSPKSMRLSSEIWTLCVVYLSFLGRYDPRALFPPVTSTLSPSIGINYTPLPLCAYADTRKSIISNCW